MLKPANLVKNRVLVCGGAGFIGYHLCKALLDLGNSVYCIDNYSTGSKSNITKLRSYNNFTFIQHDVCQPFFLQVDAIYNLACPASPIQYQQDPISTFKTNIFGAINCLELAQSCSATVLQASTSEVYGDPLVHPQSEDYWGNVHPNGIRSCYDEGKRAAESIFFDYHRMRAVKIKVARIFNTYGPYMNKTDGRVISNFICQALQNQEITIYGNGLQTRSLCYVDDLVQALIVLMQSPKEILGPINIGNPVEYNIIALAQKIIELTDSTSILSYKKLPEDDPQKRQPDITRAIQSLDWVPTTNLEKGLIKTIAYFKSIL